MFTRRRAGLFALLAVAAVGLLILFSAPAASAATADEDSGSALSTAQAVVLGAVEGFTEYLPVSSTGHLLVAERLMDLGTGSDKDATDTYTVVIQIGAILAVLGIYRMRFVSMIDGVRGRSPEGRSTLIALVVAFIPAAIVGQVFGDKIKEHLLEPFPVAIAWIAGAVAIFVFVAFSDRIKVTTTSVAAITWQQAGMIGLAQTLALWPGTSRSLITLLAALLLGIGMSAAVEFSFLLGFVTLSAATVYELAKNGSNLIDQFGLLNPIIGIVVAGVTAWISVRWMVSYLQKHSLAIFGWYRIAVGVVVIGLIATDVI